VADLLMPIFYRFLYRRSTAWLFTYDAGAVACSFAAKVR
jgi:hypothetical protein